jgi:hypothetical protein
MEYYSSMKRNKYVTILINIKNHNAGRKKPDIGRYYMIPLM